jgi:uncharacterized protein (TIGR02001 family)
MRASLAFLCAITTPAPVSAESRVKDFLGGSLAVTSDYVYRGISLSYGQVAYQGGVHLRLPSQWQVGIWGSTVENFWGRGDPFEATAFVAHAWTLDANWSLQAGYTHYQYFGEPTLLGYDHDELFASASFQSRLTLGITYSPNVGRYQYQQPVLRAAATAVDATWSQPLISVWSATAGAGYYDVSALYGEGYGYWHLGLTGGVGPVELDVIYVDTSTQAAYIYGNSISGPRWSATARWRF